MQTWISSANANLATIPTLPVQTDAVTLAGACRETGLVFLRESDRWGQGELAMWLMGPYGALTQYHSTYARRRTGVIVRRLPGLRGLDRVVAQRAVREARASVHATLASMRDPEAGASFAFGMMASGFVARCEDAQGNLGWMPTTEPRRLTDCVLSLFATHYLAQPADYDRAFSIPPASPVSTMCRRQLTTPYSQRLP